jgi:hypothetical protein
MPGPYTHWESTKQVFKQLFVWLKCRRRHLDHSRLLELPDILASLETTDEINIVAVIAGLRSITIIAVESQSQQRRK